MKFTELTFEEVVSLLAKKGFYVGCYYLESSQGFRHSNLQPVGCASFKGGFCYYGTR